MLLEAMHVCEEAMHVCKEAMHVCKEANPTCAKGTLPRLGRIGFDSEPASISTEIVVMCHHTPRGHPAAKDLCFKNERSFAAAQDDRQIMPVSSIELTMRNV